MTTTLPIRKTESIVDELGQMHDRIMKRAFEIFDSHGHRHGQDFDHWLQAERELVWRPSIELEERDNKFLLRVAVPGVEPKDIDIEVTADEILVKGEFHHDHKETNGDVHTCEFGSGRLFRSVRLPKRINPDKVKAEFKDGMLHVTAEAAAQTEAKKVELKAS